MKKKLVLSVSLALVLSLTACGRSFKKADTAPIPTQNLSMSTSFEYSKNLADAALESYLGKEYDTDYSVALLDAPRLPEASKRIDLDVAASYTVSRWLLHAVNNAILLPGCPLYKKSNTAAPGFSLDKAFQKAMFPKGKAPNILPLDEYGVPTEDFRAWFLERAIKVGLLDGRLNVEDGSEGKVYVNVEDCVQSKGGLTFKVFDSTYTIDESSLVIDSVGELVVKSYAYYDTGIYKVTYVTDTKIETSDTKEITVSFCHTPTQSGEKELEAFLSGITQLSITMQ